ncbi:extracellular solute-binding protein [Clostridium cibarium]|uniref:Extracellular solute-binding protein n=1 Tax=Clostridium cibarium TaxID=2762247 RepID=A0ABR8PRG0_9CLOT|nr:extracellular solute-binding protein [Clostridium cibarium]MBD7910758.1 extracellular solute-binding protein [Clostridium cibarium]
MKKMLKPITAMITLCTLLGTFVGCSAKDKEESLDSISIVAPLNSIDEPEKNSEILSKLEELTEMKVDIKWIPKGNYKAKSTAMIASGECPDILVVEDITEDIVKGVDQGGFWQVDDYITGYENLSNGDKAIQNNASFKGKTYGIYRYKDMVDNSMIFRKDWLDKLGLKEPQNIDEFTEILRRFRDSDPDENGIKDTYGLGIAGADEGKFNDIFNQIAAWFGAPNGWKVKDDKLVPAFTTEEYKKALDYMRKIYDEGYIDPKCYLKNNSDVEDNFFNNKYGVIFEKLSKAVDLEKSIKEKNPNSETDKLITTISSIKVNENSKVFGGKGYSGMLMFPKKGIKSEEKLRKVLGFVDKLNSKECYTLLNYGILGENYTIENGEYKSLQNSTTYDLLSFSELSINWNKESLSTNEKSNFRKNLSKVQDLKEDNIIENPVLNLKTEGYINNEQSVLSDLESINAKYIFGELDKSQYESALREWLENEGDSYIEKVNKLYEEYLYK